ncbi:fungal-specific transcription factor domain-containing protein [Mycena haematopus]|nr:fungal-specific transcription factor domain-containing protein [Mycena haematopus]
MSSEERDAIAAPVKRRRIQRACDICRKKRQACDGFRSSIRKCSYCVDNRLECIYSGVVATTQRPSYTQVLQARLALTEQMLRKLSEEGTPHSSASAGSSEWSKDSPGVPQRYAKSSSGNASSAVELATISIRTINERDPDPQYHHDDDRAQIELVQTIDALRLTNHSTDTFLGKSSGAMLFKTALELKEDYNMHTNLDSGQQPRPGLQPFPLESQRMEYWAGTPWEIGLNHKPRYSFPPPDLLSTLVELYFRHINVFIPLLHRPTVERAIADNLHLRDAKFGVNVLSVCAIASRFSDDPRVFDAAKPLSCGWKYFSQIETQPEHLYVSPTLYDLQRYCLAIQFLDCSTQHGTWTLIGTGIRIAQELGAHRRQLVGPHTVDAELLRRAFWMLISYDRAVSLSLGRPCAMQHDDFEAELPTETDDEYWEHDFCQPLGKPSQVAFYNTYLRLSNILAFVLRLLYPSSKAKNLYATGNPAWDEHIVAELDSALNKWVDGIPGHLQWDARRSDPIFFKQSVILYSTYYLVQMTTHRPFIPMVRQAPTTLPSLAICTNAARSCSHVVDVWCQRFKETPAVILLPALTTSAVILLLNVWSGKRTGLSPHMNTAITDVHKCMQAIRLLESRWQMAGVQWDILNALASFGHVPLPSGTTTTAPHADSAVPPIVHRRKRVHTHVGYEEEVRDTAPLDDTPTASRDLLDLDEAPFLWTGALDQAQGHAFLPLPTSGVDLGRLPVSFPPPPNYAFRPSVLPYHGAHYPSTVGLALESSCTSAIPQQHPMPQVVLQSGVGVANADVLTSKIDNDAMAMWMNAPTTLGGADWGTFFNIMTALDSEPPR